MGDLSKNFSTREFECPCCGKVKVSPRLVAALQRFRDMLDRPIYIISGYRCKKYNKLVRGVKASQHLKGFAADIKTGQSPVELAPYAQSVREFREGGIGVYVWGLHVDVRQIGHPARWGLKWRK